MNNLKAKKRETVTAGQLNKLRDSGFIPAILYGGKDPNAKISIEKKNIKNVRVKANPRWMALAGKPFTIPILKTKGKGEAIQSWKAVHKIAIEATIFKWSPVRFLVGDKSSLILSFILLWIFWFIIERIHYYKKKGPKILGLFNSVK